MIDNQPNYVASIIRHYGALMYLVDYIVSQTSDRAADIAARALPLVAPLPNAIGLYFVSQSALGFSDTQAFLFALAIECGLFALVEVTLMMYDKYLIDTRYKVPLSVMCFVTVSLLIVVIVVVCALEVRTGGHWILALLPVISGAAAIGLACKRWHIRNQEDVAQRTTKSTVQKPKTVVQTMHNEVVQVEPDAQPPDTGTIDKRSRAHQLHSEGLSNTEIGRELNVHRNTVSAWLRSNGHKEIAQ